MDTRDNSIEPHARLIASLAETMRDGMWTSDIDDRCVEIIKAVNEIRRVIAPRRGGDR